MSKKLVKIFLASPGNVQEERDIFFTSLPKLSDQNGPDFSPRGYELISSSVGYRPQDLINQEVDVCDIFIVVFHRRWGQISLDSVVSKSYTEEEFDRALRRLRKEGKPQIFCFFKNIELPQLADPGPQLSKVLDFRKRLEQSGSILYRTFNTPKEFKSELQTHLLAYAHGDLPGSNLPRKPVHLPVLEDAGPERNRDRDLAIVEQARRAANSGRIEEADRIFAQLSQTTVNISALELAIQFFESTRNTDAVETVKDRKFSLLRDRRLAAQEYVTSVDITGWAKAIIVQNIEDAAEEDKQAVERVYKAVFGDLFQDIMLKILAENFTVGELRSLARFYSGEGATIAQKMADFMTKSLPPVIEELKESVMHELEGR